MISLRPFIMFYTRFINFFPYFAPLILLSEIKDILDTNINGTDEKLFVESSKHIDEDRREDVIQRYNFCIECGCKYPKRRLFCKRRVISKR